MRIRVHDDAFWLRKPIEQTDTACFTIMSRYEPLQFDFPYLNC